MFVWGSADACCPPWPCSSVLFCPWRPLTAALLFLLWSSSCLFCFSAIQLHGTAHAETHLNPILQHHYQQYHSASQCQQL